MHPKMRPMQPAPALSIVMPIFNDEKTLTATLQSALAQTVREIEIVCVDDASTDGSVAVIERFCADDERVRLIRHTDNLSAFQARRTGVAAASADYVMFLDGDDDLAEDAAEKILAHAHIHDVDIVGFGVQVVERSGATGGAYEARLQPPQQQFVGDDVLRALFPVGKPAQGQLWRFAYRTHVLREAYALVPANLTLPRVNDLPLLFLAAAVARSYSAIPDKLYHYHFGRGRSGHRITSLDHAIFYTTAINSVDSIRLSIEDLAARHGDPALLWASYESARLSLIGYVCYQLTETSDAELVDAALAHLHTVASSRDIVRAAARFYPRTLGTLKYHTRWEGFESHAARSILIATSTLRTGGVSAVVASQARHLRDAGYRVTVVARNPGSDLTVLPEDVAFVELKSRRLLEQLAQWAEICREYEIDVVVDHQILYMDAWPEFSLVARSEGAATIGWVHNFSMRPLYDGTQRLTLIEQCAPTLASLIVLSRLDVAYFRLRGVDHAFYLPNPPSPLLLDSTAPSTPRRAPAGRIELVWWGRLEERTKQVTQLLEVASELQRLGVDFRLRIIGPGWDDLTPKKLTALVRRRNLSDRVIVMGPLHGAGLVAQIDASHAFVSTSIIEGYQLTIAEAQSRGLPVLMYELPWLTLVQDNGGVVAAPQGDARRLAARIAATLTDPEQYERLSIASLDSARRAQSPDFASLYPAAVNGVLPSEYSPAPSLEDARTLLGLMAFFTSRSPRGGSKPAGSSGLGRSVWSSLSPLGRATLRRFPGLRPLAHRARKWLGAR